MITLVYLWIIMIYEYIIYYNRGQCELNQILKTIGKYLAIFNHF